MRKYIVFITVLISFFLCSCVETPEVKTENGLSYAKEEGGQEVEAVLQNEKDMSLYITPCEGGYQIACHLGENETRLDIDAFVEDIYTHDVHPLTARAGKLEQEDICRMFFEQGGAKDITEEYLRELAEEIAQVPEEDRVENQLHMEPTQEFYLQGATEEGRERSFELSGTNFNYFDMQLYIQNEDILRGKHDYGLTEDISNDFTIAMAWEKFAEAMKRIGMEGVKLVSCGASISHDGEGFYDMEYTTIINGIPILPRKQFVLGYLCPYGTVEIGKEGIAEIQAYDLLWEQTEVVDENVIAVEDMLAILNQYVSDNKIAYTSGVTYDACEMVYIMKTDNWKTATFYPVWHLYVKQHYPSGQKEGVLFGKDVEVKEILIHAITGEVVRW